MLRHDLGCDAHLRIFEERDAEELFKVVDAYRDDLARSLAWVGRARGPHSVLDYIRRTRRRLADNNGYDLAIVREDEIIGSVGFNEIRWVSGTTTLGYWLAPPHRGRGTMTLAAGALAEHALTTLGLRRVEIRTERDNAASQAVARRLGFRRQEALRSLPTVRGLNTPHVVFTAIAGEWARP